MLLSSAFAQKNFNTITFSRFLTSTGNGSALNQGVFAIKGSANNLKVDRTEKTGTININTADSTITVKCDGDEDKIFKIGTVYKEEKNQYKTQTVLITCKDKMRTDFSLIITRDKSGKASNQMNVKIIEANNDGYEYTCTYLKDLFKN